MILNVRVVIQVKTKKWLVYVHINKFNGKRYVGITSRQNPEIRWRAGRGYDQSPRFASAIKRYGWDGFKHVILLEGLSETIAKEKEKEYISLWRTQEKDYGYNLTSGGDGTSGYHPSKETIEKLSAARRKENLSPETLARRSQGLKGRKFSEEHKRKIGDGNSKAIKMMDRGDTLLRTFNSAREAEILLNISHSHISQCCHGHRQTAGGYKWQFINSYNP